ncbi:MAG: vitamin K epoxide reductase family protein [Candidatus Limnocylindrus sp.]
MSRSHRISALVSAAGLVISAYLLSIRLIGVPAICGPALGPFGGCSKVEASAWSSIGPIPVAAIGVIGSAVLLVATIMHARNRSEGTLAVWLFAALAGAAIEVGLIAIQAFVIGAWCVWCLLYGSTVLVGAASVIRVARSYAREAHDSSPLRR